MSDLLVKLYALGSAPPAGAQVTLRPAMAYERDLVVNWVRAQFGAGWASECEVAFARNPIACLVATLDGKLLGFACYDCTARGLFGPIGVAAPQRGRGVGRALLHAGLAAMAARGYAYAVIGGVAEPAFYQKTVGAIEIPDSTPGLYRDRLHPVQS